MVSVLVGGKKREDVLRAHKDRLDSSPDEDGKVPVTNPTESPRFAWGEVEIELYSPADHNGKYTMRCDSSLESLAIRGFDRHLSPDEYATLLIEGLRGTLPTPLNQAYANIITGPGEWTNCILKKEGDGLIAVKNIHPRSVTTPNDQYIVDIPVGYECKFLPLTGLVFGAFNPLKDLTTTNPKLAKFLYGSEAFDTFPPFIQTGGGLLIEESTEYLFVTIGGNPTPYYFSAKANPSAASRGIRDLQKPPSPGGIP